MKFWTGILRGVGNWKIEYDGSTKEAMLELIAILKSRVEDIDAGLIPD